jgi:hypothetical protein
VSPPERILLQHLVLLEVLPHAPPLIVRQSQPVLLEQCIYTRDTSVPRILQVVQS